MKTIIQVAVPTPLRNPFDYLPPKEGTLSACKPGMRVLVPLGKRQVIGIISSIKDETDVDLKRLRHVQQLLDDEPVINPALMNLCFWAARYYNHSHGDVFQSAMPKALRVPGNLAAEISPYWATTRKGQLVNLESLAKAPRQQHALSTLKEYKKGLSSQVLSSLGVNSGHLKALCDKGLAQKLARKQQYESWDKSNVLREALPDLNTEQRAAFDKISSFSGFAVHLLDGITGSGKTEVYLQCIQKQLEIGNQALVLVPEIGLTPQTIKRFHNRFNCPVVALHSGLADGERLEAWRRARTGAASVIIGTRSALFTPMLNPGLIIVDEEHDHSYKQQDGFRYSARDLAVMRAREEKIPVILGSATPSLESLLNAKRKRYNHLLLRERAGAATPPSFQLIDLRQQDLQYGLATTVITRIRFELNQGNQALLFLNRRGFSPVLMCHDCGWNANCARCDSHMALHKKPARLHCHHCDNQTGIPCHCPECGSTDLRPIGQGTEQLEDNLVQLFPDTRIIRVDRDTTGRKNAMHNLLKEVHSGKPCLLVGTQMLAKGHHFPNVTVVTITNTDAGLFATDFRAPEHLSQLLTQVAGRAGRAGKPGTVFLQTRQPQHPVLQTLINNGYPHTAQLILEERKLTEMPPYSHMVLVRAEAIQPEPASRFLEEAARLITKNLAAKEQVDIWGPIPAIMARRAGRYRFQLMLRSTSRPGLQALLARSTPAIDNILSNNRVRWHLDVDPISLD